MRILKIKKAQLQLMENALVIMVVFFILIIAFVFFIGFQRQQQKEKDREFKHLELIKKTQILSYLTEMQCSDNNVFTSTCYDLLKIESFKEILKTEKFYYDSILGNINLYIKRYEPSVDCNDCVNGNRWLKEWLIYDNPKKENKGFLEIQMPILLNDVVNDNSYFGVLFLRVYE